MLQLKLFIFYLSYLVFPFMIYLFYKIKTLKKSSKKIKISIIFLLILSFIFIDARFIEPNYIKVKTTKIDLGFNENIKIALISDIHLGIYKKEDFLEKVVKKINKIENLNYVFIAGDLTYFDKKENNFELEKLFKSLKNIKVPVYSILGNHDVELPGPKVRKKLTKVLKDNNIKFLNNTIVKLNGFTLVGLGPYWGGEDDITILDNFSIKDNIIVLTHNPDTTLKYKNKSADLTLCGHTHGGQIKIPFLYKLVIPTSGDFDKGLTKEKSTKLFITSGLGLSGIPLRFLNPPIIDVLEVE